MSAPPDPPKSPPPTQSDGSVLSFPERFHEAVRYVRANIEGLQQVSDEKKLMFYALQQQAEQGPCKEAKPWGWNVIESAKWNSWSQLQDMAPVEAMRLYVKVLEEEVQPDWWMLSRGQQLEKSQSQQLGAAAGAADRRQRSLRDTAVPGSWAEASAHGPKLPPPRYEHAIAVVRGILFVIGGNCGGRYLNDVWKLDLSNLVWQLQTTTAAPVEAVGGGEHVQPSSEEEQALLNPSFPPLAGHALVVWGTTILCVGGHTKSKAGGQPLVVRALDTSTNVWSVLGTHGPTPPNRGSHTATLIGNKIYVFGGEEKSRRTAADLFVLNLDNLTWETLEVQGGGPTPRSAHSATAWADRYLLIFGGGSVANCFNDLWILDTKEGAWEFVHPSGALPAPRAGHAGAVLHGKWYIAGGGNNKSGCSDVVAINLQTLSSSSEQEEKPQWEFVTESDASSPVVSEGMGMVSQADLLLTFGGYNGKYHNSIHVFASEAQDTLTSSPKDTAQKLLEPLQNAAKAVVEPLLGKQSTGEASHASAFANQPKVLLNGHASSQTGNASTPRSGTLDRMTSFEAVARDAAASREAIQSEMVLMRKQLNTALEAKALVEKERDRLKEQLSAAREKSIKLEVELAEGRNRLQSVAELEKELNHYRKMFEEVERGKNKGGLWNYISGADKV